MARSRADTGSGSRTLGRFRSRRRCLGGPSARSSTRAASPPPTLAAVAFHGLLGEIDERCGCAYTAVRKLRVDRGEAMRKARLAVVADQSRRVPLRRRRGWCSGARLASSAVSDGSVLGRSSDTTYRIPHPRTAFELARTSLPYESILVAVMGARSRRGNRREGERLVRVCCVGWAAPRVRRLIG